MSESTLWLGRMTAAIIALALVALGVTLFGQPDSAGRIALRSYLAELDRRLRFLRSTVRARHVLAGQIAVSVTCLVAAAAAGMWPILLAIPAVAIAPKIIIEQRAAQRISKVEEQVEPWLNAVANALKASPSLGDAIASTTTLVPAPISQEVDLLVKEYELGTPLDRALDNLAERIGSRTLSGTVLALKVARKSGGNLPEMLESAAAALRELARLEGVVRTKTAEGKAQTLVIGVVPVPMIAGVHAIDPAFFNPLVQTFLGNLIIAGAAALWAIAIVAARKILAVDV